MPLCPHCNSERVRNAGMLSSGTKRFKCNSCSKWFTNNPRKFKVKTTKTKRNRSVAKCKVCKVEKPCTTTGERTKHSFIYRNDRGQRWHRATCPDCHALAKSSLYCVEFHPTRKCRDCNNSLETDRYFQCHTCNPTLESEDVFMERAEGVHWD